MPRKTVYSEDLRATDEIELGGTELFLTDVIIDNDTEGEVTLLAHPANSPELRFTMTLPKYWPTTVRRK